MKRLINLYFFASIFLLGSLSSLEANECLSASLRKEVLAVVKRLNAIEAQQRNEIVDLRNRLDKNQKELAAFCKQLEELKNQKLDIPAELSKRIEQSQKQISDSREIERLLVKYGNNPDGMSALHYAIKQGDANAVALLLANGADVNARDGAYTSLTRAASCDQFEVAQLLLSSGADINLTTDQNGKYYAIHYAAEFGSGNLVALLIANGAYLDRIRPHIAGSAPVYPLTPLHTAAHAGNYEAVIALVNGGATIDGNVPKNVGVGHPQEGTPLDHAAHALKYSDDPQNLELIKFLVTHGARRAAGQTPQCPVIAGYLQSMKR